MIREEIQRSIKMAIEAAQKNGKFPPFDIPEIDIYVPPKGIEGDYATTVSGSIARIIKDSPENVSGKIIEFYQGDHDSKVNTIIKTPPQSVYLTHCVKKEYLQKEVENILKQKEKYGNLNIGKNKKVNVEFISANPTGPLTLGNGRGGFCGDVLTNILNKTGFKASREYYINDTGEQVIKLGHSILGDAEAVYKGKYIEDLRFKIKDKSSVEKVGEQGAKIILEEMLKPSIKKMGINFDKWFSEKSLYQKKEVDEVLDLLKKEGLTYEQEGAMWLKTKQGGDDKDRVLIKSDGQKTYFASDIAYLKNKLDRKFDKLIMYLGADHYGYIGRISSFAKSLSGKENFSELVNTEEESVFQYKGKEKMLRIIIMQLVKLFSEGQEVRMSKRTGLYVTIDELIDEVGLDVARFFFLTRDHNSHLNFDLELAKEQSQKNPVYYVQYAHARICSILAKANGQKPETKNLNLLNHESELALIKKLMQFPEIIEDIAKDYQIQRLPQYSMDLATSFHKFYQDCQVISEDKKLTSARLALVFATKIVLKNTFDLMGISAPEKM